jgi:hypothetical protein
MTLWRFAKRLEQLQFLYAGLRKVKILILSKEVRRGEERGPRVMCREGRNKKGRRGPQMGRFGSEGMRKLRMRKSEGK